MGLNLNNHTNDNNNNTGAFPTVGIGQVDVPTGQHMGGLDDVVELVSKCEIVQ